MTDRMLSAEKLSTLLRHLVSLGYYDSATIDRIEQAMCFGWLDADRPEVNALNAIKALADNIERVAFESPPPNPHTPVLVMRCNEIRRYVRQEIADRPECPRCGDSGTEEIKRQGGITEYWPCDCGATAEGGK